MSSRGVFSDVLEAESAPLLPHMRLDPSILVESLVEGRIVVDKCAHVSKMDVILTF